MTALFSRPRLAASLSAAACLALAACAPVAQTSQTAAPITTTTAPSPATMPQPSPAPAATAAPAQSPASESLLTAYHWALTAPADWTLPGEPAPVLQFARGQLAVANLCNQLGARYHLEGQTPQGAALHISPPMSTLRACANTALMALEQRLAAQLPKAQRYQLNTPAGQPPQLTLHFADGSHWRLSGEPTAQTRYGSTPQRMFLEVAGQRMRCAHPLIVDATCLQVREVHYGENGIKHHVGPWMPFYEAIEGFTHEPGLRTILRVDRYYRRDTPAADGSAFAYVLDMVVESERLK